MLFTFASFGAQLGAGIIGLLAGFVVGAFGRPILDKLIKRGEDKAGEL